MDLTARIRRRQRSGGGDRLVVDAEAISPVAHVAEPTARGSILERLLDHLDPVFAGDLPPDAYVWGPQGAGKSAVVTALFDRLDAELSPSPSAIYTTTRPQADGTPAFAYVDARRASSSFALYHAILDATVETSVPGRGVGTEELRSRLRDALATPDAGAVVAVDHVGEPETLDLSALREALDPVGPALAWVAVGREDPAAVGDAALPPERIEVPAYRRHALVDVLTGRASAGLADRALGHDQIRALADWADGDAHDALAALL
ncbi:MAG: Cdc6/Cdc18 family protein, partial [Haloarculaceae archaeon]